MKLIDSKSKRMISILNLLVSQNKWWTIQEFVDLEIGSFRAIQHDLEIMKSYQTDDHEPLLQFKLRKGMHISFSQRLRVDYYIKKILLENTSIQLAIGIILEPQKSFVEWVNDLNVSRSTLYSSIKKINEELKEDDIELRSDTMQFHGNEKEIRRFFVEFTFEIYGNDHWPFLHIDKQSVSAFLSKLCEIFHINLPEISINKYYFLVAILIQRLKEKKMIPPEIYSIRLELLSPELRKLFDSLQNWLLEEISNQFNITISPTEATYFLIALPTVGNFKTNYSIQEKSNLLQLLFSDLFNRIQCFIQQLDNFYLQKIANRQELAIILLQFYLNTKDLKGNSDFVFKKTNKYLEQIQRILPYFYERMTYLIQQLHADDLLASFVKNQEELICLITSNWRGLMSLELQKKRPINVFIISALGFNHTLLIGEVMRDHIPHHFQIITSNIQSLDEQFLSEQKIDLIITDIGLPKDVNLPIIKISPFPTQKEFECINNLIIELF
ncbi:helix-turn-helix domain-containing protein [Bacillus safensis]|uniref:helix-turn-helix domain-containing protein n=1 Tax=Bacillus safensis TaxID=561879 RepID=UPI002280DEE9|nr:helix-turn-helix domain-containing protein [Bacillus safensis]MCY7674726.1 helix-turn-helix domain-containing protein [Bacillus safensis]MCY7697460.1 helix-turn-helix domain-containing protein [Bacillus safensis]MEC3627391.1 helix-turn-helix domain-containing protein [Bacillus safensis]